MKNAPQSEELPVHQEKPPATALARVERPPLLQFNVEALVEKAIDAKSAVEVLERLQAMRREMRAEQAQSAFDEAMSAFQSECPPILKEKGVKTNAGQTAYKYAPMEFIETQIRPILRKHGFSHTFDTDTASAAGWVIAKCIVTHKDGHSRISTAKFPLGTKTAIMSDTQQFAAALTFANRRALCNAYGLVLAGEDMDGSTGKLKPPGPSATAPDAPTLKPLCDEIWKLLTPVAPCGDGPKNWDTRNQWLWDNNILDGAIPESMPNLPMARLKQVLAKVQEELR